MKVMFAGESRIMIELSTDYSNICFTVFHEGEELEFSMDLYTAQSLVDKLNTIIKVAKANDLSIHKT